MGQDQLRDASLLGGASGVTRRGVASACGIFLLIVGPVCLVYQQPCSLGGFDQLRELTPASHWQLFRPADDPAYPWPAIVFGYPVMAIWYWCANQTIVQRALGAKDLGEAQKGILFTGYLKILVPVIFFLPGIICLALHPDLEDADNAFMTMVISYLPHGMIGLIVAVLMAALISTVNSMLNSASTIFTLDIYQKKIRKDADDKTLLRVGQLITGLVALFAFFIAFGLDAVEGMNLFDLINSIFSFLSPSLAVVFLLGITWKKATPKAAYYTLIFGNIPSVAIGICYLANWPSKGFWPHFLLMAFYLFVVLLVFMVVVSLLTAKNAPTTSLPTLKEANAAFYKDNINHKKIWIGWIILATLMVTLYLIFN